jgi:hypothetical protein
MFAGVDLSTARNLTQDQVDEACMQPGTRLPAGLVLHSCRGAHMVVIRPSRGGQR